MNVTEVRTPGHPDRLHDLNLLRMMQAANERAVGELGPLLPGASPVEPKQRAPHLTAPWHTEFAAVTDNESEDEAMKQTVATVALAAAGMLAACQSSERSPDGVVTANLSAITDPNSTASAKDAPGVDADDVNRALDKDGRLTIDARDLVVDLTAPVCREFTNTVSVCDDVRLEIQKTGEAKQALSSTTVYLDRSATFYRGPLSGETVHTFTFSDVDGDGHEDLLVWTGREGGYGGPSFDVYLYTPEERKFTFSREFSDLTVGYSGLFQINDGKIEVAAADGCCFHVFESYVVEARKPKLIERVTKDSTNGREDDPKVIVQRLVNGKLEVVDQ